MKNERWTEWRITKLDEGYYVERNKVESIEGERKESNVWSGGYATLDRALQTIKRQDEPIPAYVGPVPPGIEFTPDTAS